MDTHCSVEIALQLLTAESGSTTSQTPSEANMTTLSPMTCDLNSDVWVLLTIRTS
eukprot:TRINITY_DN7126_c0_g1_i1.p2 TRINITY_DN7126_c0_g1~~TRINITY_DN7126_c0_g1_i1.p2  ORF type:complete len:55 (-),score=4.45 TRINITY_DN7126_c0_g1_i1:41-205(-)